MAQKTSLVQRVLRRLLASGRGEVRAMEDAMHLAGVLRFIGIFLLTVVLPAALLAYFGVASIQTEEQSAGSELKRDAVGLADTFWTQTDRLFTGFEERVIDRLEAGRSPLEGRGELHPHLLVALRFDENGQLVAPFVWEEQSPTGGIPELFDARWRAAWEAERKGEDPLAVARMYAQASQQASSRMIEGRARLDRARMLSRAGREREASAVLDEVEAGFAGVRDPWGIRLGDLVRLERASLLLAREPDAGVAALRHVVDDLLAARWVVGEGGEAAVARRALSLLEPYGEREWAAVARGRVSERSAMLFWTGQLLPDLEQLVAGATDLRVSPGDLRWRTGERALWATTWWGEEFYAFGLDREALVSELKADARAMTLPDSPMVSWLVGPNEAVTGDVLAQRNLAPWLSDWSLVIAPRNPELISEQRARKRQQRLGVVGLAVVMIAVGAVMSARLIKRELDIARMQTSFAANVSHELRSPITQIRLKGESLLLGLAETEQEQMDAYRAIVRESERLSRLVDNVLDFSAIERGAKRYALRPGDVADTVLRAVDAISSALELADKELDVDLPSDLPTVYHDADAVSQCVINLVSNAAKYSDKGGWIGIRGRVTDGWVEISVSDKGIGIPPHDLRHIFEPFYRSGDSLARRRKGTGIGLTITRYIMRAHGGDVSVSSRPGEGSTFTLRFPLQPPPEAARQRRPHDRAGRAFHGA